jgi:glycosyltransferase involved in cell wall biosynthesis
MKIIYLHQYFNTPDMIGGTRSYEIARRLTKRGHEVHMVTSYQGKTKEKTWFKTNEDGINVYWLPVRYSNHMSYFRRVFAFLRFSLYATILACRLKGDLIYATSTPLTIALPAIIAKRWARIPMIFEVRDLWPELPVAIGALKNVLLIKFAKFMELAAYKNSSAIIALSPGMKAGVVKRGISPTKVGVVPNSADISRFTSLERLKEYEVFSNFTWFSKCPILVYTGTLGYINGVGFLVDLARELNLIKSNVKIFVIGDGVERSKIEAYAISTGVLDDNFFMLPPVPKAEIPQILYHATMVSCLFIDLPEMRSNSANKFFDGLAAGKPVFINFGGWLHEVVSDSGCGISGWDKPIDLVAFQVNEYLNDVASLSKGANAARMIANQLFDRDTLASQVINIVESVEAGNGHLAEQLARGDFSFKSY